MNTFFDKDERILTQMYVLPDMNTSIAACTLFCFKICVHLRSSPDVSGQVVANIFFVYIRVISG